MEMLGPADPAPVTVFNRRSRSPFLLLGDHAGNAIPEALGTLGLEAADRSRHIAWDIGVRDLGETLARRLDATFVHQPYSRLVIDCNRDPGSPEAIVARADGSEVAGNASLTDAQVAARTGSIHTAYHDAITVEIAQRVAAGNAPIIVALHSFTPIMGGVARPWEIGVLFDGGETRFARAVLAALRTRPDLVVGDNEPYRMDVTDYTVPHHAYRTMISYVELEIRQDLLATDDDRQHWALILEQALTAARSAAA